MVSMNFVILMLAVVKVALIPIRDVLSLLMMTENKNVNLRVKVRDNNIINIFVNLDSCQ